jgi:tetrahydromethanopterin S-methyltransferase subunit A
LREKFESIAGRICEVLIPIKHEYYIGDEEKNVAICTFSTIDLLETISKARDVMSRILLVGRLLSENKGIDTLLKFTLKYPNLHHIVVWQGDKRTQSRTSIVISSQKWSK